MARTALLAHPSPVRWVLRAASCWDGEGSGRGSALGDGEQAAPGEVLGEDPPDHPRGLGVGFELVQPLSVGGLGRVGARSGVGDAVAVGGRPPRNRPSIAAWAAMAERTAA